MRDVIHTPAECDEQLPDRAFAHSRNHRLRRRVDGREIRAIGAAKRVGKLARKERRARVPMRLKRNDQLTGMIFACRGDRRPHRRRVVGVIVHHGEAAVPREHVESAADAAERAERRRDAGKRQSQRVADGDGGERVLHVHGTGHGQLDAAEPVLAREDLETRPKAFERDVRGAHAGMPVQSVRDERRAQVVRRQ